MFVRFKRTYFGPDCILYPAKPEGVEVPDGFMLPEDAVVLDELGKPIEVKTEPIALSELGKSPGGKPLGLSSKP
jgi:hypothetical protein